MLRRYRRVYECLVRTSCGSSPSSSFSCRHRSTAKNRADQNPQWNKLQQTRKSADEFVSNIGTGSATRLPQVGKPSEGSQGFFGGLFGKSARQMPMNPLQVLRKADNKSPTSQQLQKALKKMGGSARNISITEEQQIDMVREHVRGKWWGKYAMILVNFMPPSVVRSRMKLAKFGSTVSLVLLLLFCVGSYIAEMYVFGQLEPEDRVAYRNCALHMRHADLRKITEEVSAREDPPGHLPLDELISILCKELRSRGLDKKDFELEYRERASPTEEYDLYHLIYHTWLSIGSLVLWATPYGDLDPWVLYGEEVREGRKRVSVGPMKLEDTKKK